MLGCLQSSVWEGTRQSPQPFHTGLVCSRLVFCVCMWLLLPAGLLLFRQCSATAHGGADTAAVSEKCIFVCVVSKACDDVFWSQHEACACVSCGVLVTSVHRGVQAAWLCPPRGLSLYSGCSCCVAPRPFGAVSRTVLGVRRGSDFMCKMDICDLWPCAQWLDQIAWGRDAATW